MDSIFPLFGKPPLIAIFNGVMSKKLQQSILASYLIGAPIGLFGVFAIVFVPSFFFSDGLLSMVILGTFGISIIGLILAFLFSLWLGGRLVYKDISNGKPLLLTSLRYSALVNLIIWTVFYLLVLITVEEKDLVFLYATALACLFCILFTTFSVGLWISYEIKRIIYKSE